MIRASSCYTSVAVLSLVLSACSGPSASDANGSSEPSRAPAGNSAAGATGTPAGHGTSGANGKVDAGGGPGANGVDDAGVTSDVNGEAGAGGASDANGTSEPFPRGASTGLSSAKDGTAADGDGDGIADDRDLSPKTPKGVAVDSDGVPLPLTGAPNPWAAASVAAGNAASQSVPVSGTVEESGFMVIVLDPKAAFPLVFRTLASNVQSTASGFDVKGTLVLQTALGNVPIFEAEVSFRHGKGSQDIETVTGRARVAFTDFGLSDVSIDAPVAKFGYDVGSKLKSVEVSAPLNDARKYLYFQFSDKFGLQAGPLEISAPGGQAHTVVLDASDPFFFIRADLSGLGKVGEVLQNVGIGVSRQGLIPFSPANTWGISNAKPLKGQMFLDLSTSLKLPDLPISLDGKGQTVLNIDPEGNGQTIFEDPANGLRIGANRQLDISLELIPDVASLSLELGEATFEADLLKSTQSAWVSGVMYPGKSVLGDVLGVVPSNDVKFAGFISHAISNSYFDMAGDSQLQLSKLGALTGLSLSDVPLLSGTFHVAKDGVALSGHTQASFLSSLGVTADATLAAKFPGDPHLRSDWYVRLDGALSVSGVDLSASASARLSSQGAHIDGGWQSPLGQNVHMVGDITRSGIQITGTATTIIPIVSAECTCKLPKLCTQDKLCTQAKQCSVTNTCTVANTCSVPKSCKVKCSSNPLKWGSCLKSVVSASQCGVEQISDAAVCGTHLVTDYAACGSTMVQDAARCGTEFVKCGVEQVQCGTMDAVGSVCGAVCDGTIQKDAGQFVGTVALSIGSNGLSGAVEGDYLVAGKSTHLAGGRLDLTSTPKACITIDGIGEICHEF